MLRKRSLRCSPRSLATDIPGVSRISGSNPERLLTAGTAAEPMLGRGGILLCPRGFPAVTVRLKLRDGAAKSPCTCGLDSEIYRPDTPNPRPYSTSGLEHTRGGTSVIQKFRPLYVRYGSSSALNGDQVSGFRPESALLSSAILDFVENRLHKILRPA